MLKESKTASRGWSLQVISSSLGIDDLPRLATSPGNHRSQTDSHPCNQELLVGVISDTRGLLRPQGFDLFADVTCIVHAGDVGDEKILDELSTLAPVHAVYGNTDGFPLVERLPEIRFGDYPFDNVRFQLEGVGVFVTHVGGNPEEMRSLYPQVGTSDLVIFGHSHKPSNITDGGIVFFNPGSAGPRRFTLPVTVGKIGIEPSRISTEIIEIE
jgi:uncharacterized protein